MQEAGTRTICMRVKQSAAVRVERSPRELFSFLSIWYFLSLLLSRRRRLWFSYRQWLHRTHTLRIFISNRTIFAEKKSVHTKPFSENIGDTWHNSLTIPKILFPHKDVGGGGRIRWARKTTRMNYQNLCVVATNPPSIYSIYTNGVRTLYYKRHRRNKQREWEQNGS